jgi:hypothetical protein
MSDKGRQPALWPWALIAMLAGFGIAHKDELAEAALADLRQFQSQVSVVNKPQAKAETAPQQGAAEEPWRYEGHTVYSCASAAATGYQISKNPGTWQKRGELFRFYDSGKFQGWCAYKSNQ